MLSGSQRFTFFSFLTIDTPLIFGLQGTSICLRSFLPRRWTALAREPYVSSTHAGVVHLGCDLDPVRSAGERLFVAR